jgi:hypothetical protein
MMIAKKKQLKNIWLTKKGNQSYLGQDDQLNQVQGAI